MDELYVDPSINADSGAGTIGDPYGDLEYCIEQEDWSANGIRVNIKAGTAEFTAAELTIAMNDVSDPGKSVAWVPTATAPLVYQGYTAAAGDGGKGEIDGGAANFIIFNGGARNNTAFIDMHVHNVGTAAYALRFGSACAIIRCEVDGGDSRGVYFASHGLVLSSYVHDFGLYPVDVVSGNIHNTIVSNQGTRTCSIGINLSGATCTAMNNIVDVDSTSIGISMNQQNQSVIGNSVYSAAGSGIGIRHNHASISAIVVDNVIEGFSGAGGIGLDLSAGTNTGAWVIGGNSVYDCETDYVAPDLQVVDTFLQAAAYEAVAASPFADAENQDFSGVDTGSVKEGSVRTFHAI